jgi:peptide/nickel transport system substrate-binding protein
MMVMASGLDNGIPTPAVNPKALAPTSHEQLQWTQWGIHFESGGKKGSSPDLKEATELLDLYKQWRTAATTDARTQTWHRMLALYTSQVFSIGLVNSTFQPVVVSTRLRNVPDKGFYGFDPTAYFGVYGMDTFWFDGGGS